jgi:hypothetical protein
MGGDGLQLAHDCTETTLAICDAGELSRVVAGDESFLETVGRKFHRNLIPKKTGRPKNTVIWGSPD